MADMQKGHGSNYIDYDVLFYTFSKIPINAGPSKLNIKMISDTLNIKSKFPLCITKLSRHIMLDFSMGYSKLNANNDGFSVNMTFMDNSYNLYISKESIKYAEIMGAIHGTMPTNCRGQRGLISKDDNILVIDFRK